MNKDEFHISIIIPTLNEKEHIRQRLDFFSSHVDRSSFEVIVVDGGSADGTVDIVKEYGAVKLIHSSVTARPNQMNLGATHATFAWLYFVHADVKLPESFFKDIKEAAITHQIGGYRYLFDSSHLLLKVNAFFTRFPMMWCRGGDQTLFINKELFDEIGGYNEYFSVMEDFDIIRRAKQKTNYHIIPKNVIVSSRKYNKNGYWKVQMTNLKAFKMFRNGTSPDDIRVYYKDALGLKDY